MVSGWDDPPGTGSIPSHSPLCLFFQRGGDLVTVAFRAMGAVSVAKSAVWPWLGVLASLSVTLTVYILVRALRPAGVIQVDGRNPAPVDNKVSYKSGGAGFLPSTVCGVMWGQSGVVGVFRHLYIRQMEDDLTGTPSWSYIQYKRSQ